MFYTEKQVRYLTSQFMPRVKEDSVSAIIDVACHGLGVLETAKKYDVTHQSLSKNLISLKELKSKLVQVEGVLPSSYLVREYAHALLMANTSFQEALTHVETMCKSLGGEVNVIKNSSEVMFTFGESLTSMYLNPSNDYEYEWSYDYSE